MPTKTLLEYDRDELEQVVAEASKAGGVVEWGAAGFASVSSEAVVVKRGGVIKRGNLAQFVQDTEPQAKGYTAEITALNGSGMKVKLTRKAEAEAATEG